MKSSRAYFLKVLFSCENITQVLAVVGWWKDLNKRKVFDESDNNIIYPAIRLVVHKFQAENLCDSAVKLNKAFEKVCEDNVRRIYGI
jgi:hypothetical protein